MADDFDDFALAERAGELNRNMRGLDSGMRDINRSATQFGRALSGAFAQGVIGSRSLDDVLKSLSSNRWSIKLWPSDWFYIQGCQKQHPPIHFQNQEASLYAYRHGFDFVWNV